MNQTLISFLGKSRLDAQTGYRTATYNFKGTHKETPFFGLALTEVIKPKKLILIGTSGSMWDVFFEHSQVEDEHVLALMDAVAENRVTEQLLEPCLPFLQAKLGCAVECLVINYAVEEAEQIDLLLALAEKLDKQERISIDITHSFRHLPMLSLVAARYLHTVKDIITDNIYYGALEMTQDGITPVIELRGMLKMLEWTDALASYDKDGDYYPFAELYQTEKLDEAATLLRKAAFSERTNQISNARIPLRQFRSLKVDSTISSLFAPELRKRTAWVENKQYADQQLQMAEHHLSKGDYLRACLFAQEALISHLVYQQYGENDQDYTIREKIRLTLNQRVDSKKFYELDSFEQAYKNIRGIRNMLTHGTKSRNEYIKKTVNNEDKLIPVLQKDFHTLSEAIRSGKTL